MLGCDVITRLALPVMFESERAHTVGKLNAPLIIKGAQHPRQVM
jgi:hypothetical protein